MFWIGVSTAFAVGSIFLATNCAVVGQPKVIGLELKKGNHLSYCQKRVIINLLKNGNEDLRKLKEQLAKIRNDDYDSLNRIARDLFENEEIELVHNPNLAKRWIEEWFKVMTVFPQIKGKVRLIADDRPYPEGCPDGGAESFSDPGSGVYNIIHYKNMENQEKCREAERKGLFAKGPTTEYTIVHELGHVISFIIESKIGKELDINVPYANINGRKGTLEQEVLKISRYPVKVAKKSAFSPYCYNLFLSMEAIAEAFADVNTSGEAVTPLSKEIVFYIYEMINK